MSLLPGIILGFSPVHEKDWGWGTRDILQEGRAASVGITASVSDEPIWVSHAATTILKPSSSSPCGHRRKS
jgi:hypothetical protein